MRCAGVIVDGWPLVLAEIQGDSSEATSYYKWFSLPANFPLVSAQKMPKK
jgi:hypothetical protein